MEQVPFRPWTLGLLTPLPLLVTFSCASEVAREFAGTGGRSEVPEASLGGRGNGNADAGGGEGGAAGAGHDEEATPACVSTGEDQPDDRFEDTNCDGLDGDLERAIFVAPGGDDAGAGSLEEPLATLDAAMVRAHAESKDVYVCNGDYQQAVVIERSVRLFGGYDCTASGRRVTDRARFVASTNVPLVIRGASDVLIERIAFTAPNGSAVMRSSVAAVVENSQRVELRRVELESGWAGPGQAGEQAEAVPGSAPRGEDGGTACVQLQCSEFGKGGRSTAAPACEGGGTAEPGGRGGDGGHTGTPARPGSASPGGAKGGRVGSVNAERSGQAGGSGARGVAGSPPLQLVGELDGATYLPNNSGLLGGYGERGQGGGGGAGVDEFFHGDLCCVPGDGGSQGGFGGCGGRPGQGGSGGGASIALVVVASEVTLTWTRLLTGNGGKGGTGGRGGVAQAGGQAGDVSRLRGAPLAGFGGPGGPGGPGGSGGPGGGGPSLGLALHASALPRMEGVQVLLGSPGFGGDAAPDAVGATDGPDGLVAAGYDFTNHSLLTF